LPGSITLNGSDAEAWADQIGGHHLEQTTAAKQAEYSIDDHGRYLDYAGGQEMYSGAALPNLFSGDDIPLTVVAVVTDIPYDSTTRILYHFGSTSFHHAICPLSTNLFRASRKDDLAASAQFLLDPLGTTEGVLVDAYSGSNRTLYYAGLTSTLAVSLGTCSFGGNFYLGSGGGGLFLRARVREVVIIDRALDAAEAVGFSAQLSSKWRL
jgi:hypothetical protein